MTAAHHVIRVDGGAPHIIVESGRACIEVKASHGLPQLEDLLSPFVTPADQFANIGPEQAAQLTTLPQDFAEPSFPRPGDLGGPLILFNGSDRCAACINQTTVFPTTKLPSSLIPTFPTATSIDYVPHTEASLSTASRTFPTLISLQSDSSTLTTAATSEPTFTTATFPTPSKTLSPSSQPSVTQPGVPDTTVTGTAKPFPSPGDFTTIPEATVSTSKVGTDGQGAGTTATTTISGSTSDQFVIGQFEEFSSDGSSSTSTVTQSVTKPVPEILTSTPGGTMIVTASTSLPSLTTQPIEQGFPEPTSLPGTNPPDTVVTSNQVDEHFPSPTSLPVSEPGLTPVSGGGGGSWETETLFPTPPTTLPRKPSVLVLKMKIPSSLDLQSFDLTSNLTTALNEVVRESVKRVKRFKRSSREQSQEHLVEVHKIERVGNAVQVLFSVNETEVDSYMVEKDLSSLDRSYLMRFVGFPVLTKASRQMPRCPLTEKVTNITIITDETLSA
ncbi:hypothetical protein ANCCEY_13506 [Ancylostoma ceylanicum]|uniref:Uncharacterized protein n=1 Tax=Ancylostoma ceylanicum TaxID=53326 RepID=A0A0D6L8P7_9BILA|nr:hypothetical protein ANCCEY_13506 [Ancylostoma ceylanicum]